MKIATWNINSVRRRELPLVVDWLTANPTGRAVPTGDQSPG